MCGLCFFSFRKKTPKLPYYIGTNVLDLIIRQEKENK